MCMDNGGSIGVGSGKGFDTPLSEIKAHFYSPSRAESNAHRMTGDFHTAPYESKLAQRKYNHIHHGADINLHILDAISASNVGKCFTCKTSSASSRSRSQSPRLS